LYLSDDNHFINTPQIIPEQAPKEGFKIVISPDHSIFPFMGFAQLEEAYGSRQSIDQSSRGLKQASPKQSLFSTFCQQGLDFSDYPGRLFGRRICQTDTRKLRSCRRLGARRGSLICSDL
jgi:hypothetical protein